VKNLPETVSRRLSRRPGFHLGSVSVRFVAEINGTRDRFVFEYFNFPVSVSFQ
jgi:hypothetical protein